MAQVKFYIEKRKEKTENVPINLKYSFNGQRFEYFTGHRIDAKYYIDKYWTKQNAKPIKLKAPDSEYINANLETLKSHVQSIETNAKALGIALSPDYFRKELINLVKKKPEAEEVKVTFMQFFDMYIQNCKTAINESTGNRLSKASAVKYTNMRNMLKDFFAFRGETADFADLDKQLYSELVNYMIEEKDYSINTYGRAIKFIKTVLHSATEQGYNTKMDYKLVFRGTSEPSDSTYLTEVELENLFKLNLSDNFRLERVRDLFLIGCWTGLRFSDFTSIKKEDINGDRIRVKTQKTRHKVIIPIHPTVRAIIEKYNFELPPAISNQKFNEYLREVAIKAEINEPFTKHITKGGKPISITHPKHDFITSHVARRSFATNAYKRKIEPLLIMAITGHKTETEFLKYLKITDEEKADLFELSIKWE
jgi:integrase